MTTYLVRSKPWTELPLVFMGFWTDGQGVGQGVLLYNHLYIDCIYGWSSLVHDDVTNPAPHWLVGSHHESVMVVHRYYPLGMD